MSAVTVAPIRKADRRAIREHLNILFRRAEAISPGCQVTIAWSNADLTSLNEHAQFPATPVGLDKAAEHAALMNEQGRNCYVGACVRRTGTVGSGKNKDVPYALFHWAEVDDADGEVGLMLWNGATPSATITTGTTPTTRTHVYWELAEPAYDLAQWKARQKALASAICGDPAVVDERRVLRLAGTWNFAKPSKAARGYRTEMVSPVDQSGTIVTPERLMQGLEYAAPVTREESGPKVIGAPELMARDIDDLIATLQATPNDLDYAAWIAHMHAFKMACGDSPEGYEAYVEWSMQWPGNSPELIEAKWAGITESKLGAEYIYQAAAKAGVAASSAAQDFDVLEPDEEPYVAPVAKTTAPKAKIRVFGFGDIHGDDTPDEPDLIGPGLLGPGEFLLIAGPPKSMKSMLLQDLLVSAALSREVIGFSAERPLRCFWLQAEMTYKILKQRAKAETFWPNEVEQLNTNLKVSDRFHMILDADGVNYVADLILDAFGGDPPDILAFDPLANLFDGDSENDNAQMMRFLQGRMEQIRQKVNPKAGLILVHHTNKAGKDEAFEKDPFNGIRGAGALRGYYTSAVMIYRPDMAFKERKVFFDFRSGEPPEPMVVSYEDGRMVVAADPIGDFGDAADKLPPKSDRVARAEAVDKVVLWALADLFKRGRSVTDGGGQSNVFKAIIDCDLSKGAGKDELRASFNRLVKEYRIERKDMGRQSNGRPAKTWVPAAPPAKSTP